MKKRIFIVAPTEIGKSYGDTLHQICKTSSNKSLDNIYMEDLYEVVNQTDNKKDAIKIAKRMGCKKPSII